MLLVAAALGYGFDLFAKPVLWLQIPSVLECTGAAFAALLAAIAMLILSRNVRFLKNLYTELQSALPDRDWRWNTTAGLASGFAEEFAFRGVGLALLGPHWSSLLFGAMHLGWNRSMWFWPIYAALIGWALAYLTLSTGTIWAAVVFHAVYNAVLLQAMGRASSDWK